MEYIHTLRLIYARELLSDGQISAAQAALECGFENVNYFAVFSRGATMFPPAV